MNVFREYNELCRLWEQDCVNVYVCVFFKGVLVHSYIYASA